MFCLTCSRGQNKNLNFCFLFSFFGGSGCACFIYKKNYALLITVSIKFRKLVSRVIMRRILQNTAPGPSWKERDSPCCQGTGSSANWREVRQTKVWRHPHVWIVSLSQSCTINLALFVSEKSPKGNFSKLSDETDAQKTWRTPSVRANWLIAVCHQNLRDTLTR